MRLTPFATEQVAALPQKTLPSSVSHSRPHTYTRASVDKLNEKQNYMDMVISSLQFSGEIDDNTQLSKLVQVKTFSLKNSYKKCAP